LFTSLWIVWLVLFGAIEGVALANKTPGDTLSEHIWKWFSVRGKARGWMFRRAALFLFLVWLLLHMMGIGGV
jgi:hypothetical protein